MVTRLNTEQSGGGSTSRVAAENRYPAYELLASVEVAAVIHERGGGSSSADELAAFLGYSTTNSGAFLARVAAARLFGLIERSGRSYVPTELAARIMSPEYPEEALEARLESFFAVPLYQAIYERYEGRPLPPEVGLRNTLHTTYQIPTNRTALAYRVLMDSADQAGLFSTRGGARTHLVRPSRHVQAVSESDIGEGREPDDDGGQPPFQPPQAPTDPGQVRLEYIRKLIARIGQEGANDDALMDRIEKLLADAEVQQT